MLQAGRGTPTYMAPELFQEGAAQSTASDLWALGCVLYECAAGDPPFLNDSFQELVRRILHDEPQELPDASPEFADLITRMLDKNPATRITWTEMLTHPFWQFTLPVLPVPAEPALERFFARHGLAPRARDQEQHAQLEERKACARAKMCAPRKLLMQAQAVVPAHRNAHALHALLCTCYTRQPATGQHALSVHGIRAQSEAMVHAGYARVWTYHV